MLCWLTSTGTLQRTWRTFLEQENYVWALRQEEIGEVLETHTMPSGKHVRILFLLLGLAFPHIGVCLMWFSFLFFYFILLKREREHGDGGWHRERERESEANSILSTEPHLGLHPMALRSRPELKPRVGHLTDFATQAPLMWFTCKIMFSAHGIGYLSYSVPFLFFLPAEQSPGLPQSRACNLTPPIKSWDPKSYPLV